MKQSLAGSALVLAIVALHATAAVVDYVSDGPITSSSYYQYHTKWVTTTCYQTITKTKDCSYDGGDYAGDYETVTPEVYPGPDYKDYKTVFETIYETAYPYPYKTAQPYPYEAAHSYPYSSVCYPETVYSTVYPDSSNVIYHTFTESGLDETVTGSLIYHTMDETVIDTVTATPSGDPGCFGGPWIVNPGFEGSSWSGVWFPSGSVEQVDTGDAPDGSLVAQFTATPGDLQSNDPRLQQAIIIPNGEPYTLDLNFRQGAGITHGTIEITISLGSYTSAPFVIGFSEEPIIWESGSIRLGEVSDPSAPECVPVVFEIKVSALDGDPDMILQIDHILLTTRRAK